MLRSTRQSNNQIDPAILDKRNVKKEKSVFPPRNTKLKKRKKASNSGALLNSKLNMLHEVIPDNFLRNYSEECRPLKSNRNCVSRSMIAQLACKYIQFLHERVLSLEQCKY